MLFAIIAIPIYGSPLRGRGRACICMFHYCCLLFCLYLDISIYIHTCAWRFTNIVAELFAFHLLLCNHSSCQHFIINCSQFLPSTPSMADLNTAAVLFLQQVHHPRLQESFTISSREVLIRFPLTSMTLSSSKDVSISSSNTFIRSNPSSIARPLKLSLHGPWISTRRT